MEQKKKKLVRKPKEKPVFKIVVATPDAPIIVSFE